MSGGVARLDGGGVAAVFAWASEGAPVLRYLGPECVDPPPPAMCEPQPSSPDRPVPASLLPEAHFGFSGAPGITVARDGIALPTRLTVSDCRAERGRLAFRLGDTRAGIGVELDWRVTRDGMIAARSAVTNSGSGALDVHWLAAMAMALPDWVTEATRFPGRWSGEWRTERAPIPYGLHEVTSRGGRPGFDNPGWLLLAGGGNALGLHLAWSGDVRGFTERTGAGLTQVQMGEALEPGEVRLALGECYRTPEALLAFSDAELEGVRTRFHAHVRRIVPTWPLRRVHFNTWEAAYFDFDAESLGEMAEAAAALGCERFVLDDGWFSGRRDDERALGDWTVDPARFPDGLDQLIDRVHALGMDFGLWIEPEMVSPDSDLYRLHPDWCLHVAGRDRPTQRRQLVLDLSRAEVRDHLFAAIDALLADHVIAYLKWDHNRDLFPAFSGDRPCGHAQVLGLYDLIKRVRAAHPRIEIEACASGGARTDLALLAHTGRVWLSDSTDPAERERMQRAAGLFLPPEVIGSHVGLSGTADMGTRARVAMGGHMGVELDPRRLSAKDNAVLADHIARYKRLRDGR